jgi:cytochrome b561
MANNPHPLLPGGEIAMKYQRVSRYHPVLVALHWTITALLLAALLVGYLGLAIRPNVDPGKVAALRLHMAGGMLIVGLMFVRLIVRAVTSKPAETGRVVHSIHYAFYALVLLLAATGLTAAIQLGLQPIVFGGSGEPLPSTFASSPAWHAHAYLAALFAVLVVLHIVGALHRHFIVKDGLLRRMWFGRGRLA